MNRKITLLLLLSAVVLVWVPQALATQNFMIAFNATYSFAVGSRIDNCALCHTNGVLVGPMNSYGMDFENQTGHSKNPGSALVHIEGNDSDKDGFKNIDEIHNLTFPGNASDFPILTSIVVSPLTVTVTSGVTQLFIATARNQNNISMPGINITWASNNTAVGNVTPVNALTNVSGMATTTFTASTAGTAMITATNKTVRGNANATVSAQQRFGVSLTVDSAAKQTINGINATYILTINNTGTAMDNYTLAVSGNPDGATTANLSTNLIQHLAAGANTTVHLNVTSGTPGKYRVNVTAISQHDNNKSSSVNTTTSIFMANITGFTLDTTGTLGKWIKASVNITNHDTVPHWFVIDISGVANDGTTLTGYPLVGTATFWLNANGTANSNLNDIPVLVTIPAGASTGNYNLIAGIWKLEDFASPAKLITTKGQQTVNIN